LERWAQELLHISPKHLAIHGPVGDHRRGQSAAAQSTHKGHRLPMPMRHRVEATLAAGRAPVASRHARRYPDFIDKHELFDFQRGQRLQPSLACALHVLAFLLAGVQGFF